MTGTGSLDRVIDHPPREERRPVALSGWLVRAGSDQAYDFLIDDLSYGGCRLRSTAKLARGEKVQLNVLRRGTIPATVQWHNGEGIGLSFASEPPEKSQKPRKGERVPIKTELVVRHAGRRPRVLDVSDLSRFGCCLFFDDLPRKDEWLWVALPGLAPVEARIRWVEERRAGVEFVHPIHEAVFDLLLLRWGLAA